MKKRFVKITAIVAVCLTTGIGGVTAYANYNTAKKVEVIQQEKNHPAIKSKQEDQSKQDVAAKNVNKEKQVSKTIAEDKNNKELTKNNTQKKSNNEIKQDSIKEKVSTAPVIKRNEAVKNKTVLKTYKKPIEKKKVNKELKKWFNDYWTVFNVKPSASFNGKSDMKNKVQELTSGVTNDRTKAKIIFNWVINNVTYSNSLVKSALNETNSPYQLSSDYSFKTGKAICYNFAVLYSNMLSYAGIRSKVQQGTVVMDGKTGDHAWNRVLINGEWIKVDCTGHRFGYFKYQHNFQRTLIEVQ